MSSGLTFFGPKKVKKVEKSFYPSENCGLGSSKEGRKATIASEV
jgi:hypothetical protein